MKGLIVGWIDRLWLDGWILWMDGLALRQIMREIFDWTAIGGDHGLDEIIRLTK